MLSLGRANAYARKVGVSSYANVLKNGQQIGQSKNLNQKHKTKGFRDSSNIMPAKKSVNSFANHKYINTTDQSISCPRA